MTTRELRRRARSSPPSCGRSSSRWAAHYIDHVVKSSTDTYGTFALVIGLLVWLHLGAQLTLYAAEINVVLKRRLWPRSLFGPPEAPADQKTLTALAKVEERSDEQQVDVEFNPSRPSAGHQRSGGAPF